jgi:hypothetical protein
VLSELSHLDEGEAARLEKLGSALSGFDDAVSHAREDWDAPADGVFWRRWTP